MRQGDKDYTITKMATFSDRAVEEEYYSSHVFRTLPTVRRMVLLAAILFFGFCIYDIYYFGFDPSRSMHYIITRIIGLAIGLAFYFTSVKLTRARAITTFLTVFQLSIILGYIYIMYSQRAQGYPEQAMAIMLMIFAAFMFPNRWANLLLTSILPVFIFLFIGPYYVNGLSTNLRVFLLIIFMLTITLASIYFFLHGRSKREQYAEICIRIMLSNTDRLTSIYNRSKFDDELDVWCKKAADEQTCFCIILIDIDHFKDVNDTYGHLAGDEVLVNMTLAISANIRTNDIFARWGGEEFAILMPDCDIEHAGKLAARIKTIIEKKQFDTVGHVTISVGVVAYEDKDTPVSIMQRVDRALYQSKDKGRNAVTVIWSERMTSVLDDDNLTSVMY